MRKAKNIEELKKIIESDIESSLDGNVTKAIKGVMKRHIIDDVYEAYDPKEYVRRYTGTDGASSYTGLMDENNIVGRSFKTAVGMELLVSNETLGSKYYMRHKVEKGESQLRKSRNFGKPIAPVIETGEGYDIGLDADEQERPFIANTVKELKEKQIPANCIKAHLKKRGYKVK